MTRYLCLAMCLLPICCNSQSFDIKGVRLGMTEGALIAMHPGVVCGTENAVPFCVSGAAVDAKRGYAESLHTIADQPTNSWEFLLDEKGKIGKVSIKLRMESCPDVATGFRGKYGKPTKTVSALIDMDTWLRKDESLAVTGMQVESAGCRIDLASKPFVDAKMRAAEKSKAKDL